MTDTRTDIIEARRQARALSRRRGTSYQSELETYARSAGYADWRGMLEGEKTPPVPGGRLDRAEAVVLAPFVRVIGALGVIPFLALYGLVQISCLVLSLPISRDAEGMQGALLALFSVTMVLMTVGSFLSEGSPRAPRTLIPVYEPMIRLASIHIVILLVLAVGKTIIAPGPVQLWYAEHRPLALSAFSILVVTGLLSLPFARALARYRAVR